MNSWLRGLSLLLALGASSPAVSAGSFASRPEAQAFIAEMQEKHGFDAEKLTISFARIKPIPAVIQAILLARESRRDPLTFTGSYAGALGLPQFLPSSVRQYAVDGDHDDSVDLANDPADAIASVANFLKAHGWERDQPITVAASVTGEMYSGLIDEGIVPRLSPSELQAFGVTSSDAPELPVALIDLVTPQQPTGYQLGYHNFYVLTRYNRSSFYAMAVYDLSLQLRAGRSTENPP